MDLIPQLELQLDNQWILLILYAAVFLIFVLLMPPERRDWLFEDSMGRIKGWKKTVLRFGQFNTFVLLILICLTPLPFFVGAFGVVGSLLYLCGMILVPISLRSFAKAPQHKPAATGPYRFSRNPQWVGLYLVLLGLAVNTASLLVLILVLITGLTYHIQILEEERMCLEQYGQAYQVYLNQVPRYLLFF
jgi:protein-S-isoprenylcysteine O-methyltransferase Ste14